MENTVSEKLVYVSTTDPYLGRGGSKETVHCIENVLEKEYVLKSAG